MATPAPQQTAKDGLYRQNVYNTFKGVDTTSSLSAMDPDTLRVGDNCHVTLAGMIQKRKGYSNILTASDWGARVIRGGLEFQKDASTTENLVFGHQAGATTGVLGVATTSVAAIKSNLDNQRPSLFQFGKLVFYFNGTDDFIYNGTTTRQIGITAPVTLPIGVSDVDGDLVVGGAYVAVYTYYNSVTGAESSPSPLSAAVTVLAAPNDGITWTVVVGDATTADTIRLYTTVSNGASLFLDNTAAISATTITSMQADAGRITPLELDNTTIATWGKAKYATSLNSRVGVTGFASPNENRFRISKIGLIGAMPESFEATAFTDCVSSKGFQDLNIGIGSTGEEWIVLKKNSVGRVDLDSTYAEKGLVTTLGTDGIILTYKEISKAVTSTSHWAQTNVFGNLVWLGRDNVYMTDGKTAIPVANNIANDIKGYNWNYPEKLSGWNDLRNRRVMFTIITTANGTEPDYVLVGSYQNFPEFYWTFYRPGPDTSTHPGIVAGCFVDFKTVLNNYEVHFGNATFNGKLYKMNTTDSDDTLGIYFRVKDAPTSYGFPEEKKLFTKDIMFLDATTASTSMQIGACYDLSDSIEELQTVSTGLGGARWDVDLWDVGEWADEGQIRPEYSSHRKAYYKQLYFADTAAEEPVAIKGWTKTARPQEFK